MKKDERYTYLAAFLAILMPVPGRFAYGLIIILGLNLFMLFGVLFKKLLSILKLDDYNSVFTGIFLVSIAILYKQLVILYSPSIALVLGFSIYMTAVSTFLIGTLKSESKPTLKEDIIFNLKKTGIFSVAALLFFLLRDILGFGTITLPGSFGLKKFVFKFIDSQVIQGNFWASIPGALSLTSVILVIFTVIKRKIDIAGSTENTEEK